MFNKNVFTQKDPIADLIKPMLEAQTQQKLDELKGNQAVLDKNKNNKLDAQDFKILRGEKKAVKEEEEIEESSPFDWKKPREPEVKGGAGVKKGRAYGGAAQKSKPEQDDADDKKKVKEEVELKEGLGHWVVKQMARLANKNDLEHHHVNVAQKEVDRKLGTGHPQATSILNKHKKMARDAQYHKKSDDEARQHFADNMQTLHNDIKSAHSVKEEVEQVDELSRKTMKSYMKKAEPDAVQSVAAAHDKVEKYIDKTGKAPSSPKHVMKIAGNEIMRAAKRTKGIERATTKLAKEEVEQVDERTLTKGETAERERIVKGMKKGLAGFKARYGDRAKSVMYATATARAKK
jgi:hypothetical protein